MCVRSGSSAAAAVHSCAFFFAFFFALNRLLKAEVGYEGVPVVSFAVLSFWLHCSLARKAAAEQPCHSLSLVSTWKRIIYPAAKKGEKLSGQVRNRFNVKNEALWRSEGVSDDTCSPRGPTANWGTSACPGCICSFRRERTPSWAESPNTGNKMILYVISRWENV